MIHLEPITFQNPFETYPYLKEIWPPVSSLIAQKEIQLTIDNEYFGTYIIMKDYIPIGITGFFFNSNNIKELGLRWHGIISSERRKGYSKEALKIVFEEALKYYPTTEFFIEYIPLIDYNPPIIQHFTKLGFIKFGEIESPSWSYYQVQSYKINIHDFLDKYKNNTNKP